MIMIVVLAYATQVFAPNNKVKREMYATYYHNRFEQRKTTTGEIFSQRKYTAAHRTYPMNALVKITNKNNGRSVIVKVNDRCPNPNVIDMSLISAKRILLHNTGVSRVVVEKLDDSCQRLWEKQDEIFRLFDRAEFDDTYLTLHYDSTMRKFDETFSFLYYVKVLNVQDEERAKRIISQFSGSLIPKSTIKKEKEQDFIYIGGFLRREDAIDIVKNLKSSYLLSAEVVKK
ncbi:MAG: septal ring lytic transglycosylase RlpA family protein [Bacteroidales bacterium]|nr:septal ring lytic transglycosylase RlpA family protein [Bacteroidales bacterium]